MIAKIRIKHAIISENYGQILYNLWDINKKGPANMQNKFKVGTYFSQQEQKCLYLVIWWYHTNHHYNSTSIQKYILCDSQHI